MNNDSSLHSRSTQEEGVALLMRLRALIEQFATVESSLDELLLSPIRRKARPADTVTDSIRSLITEYDAVVACARGMAIEIPDGVAVPEILAQVEVKLRTQT